MTDYLPEPDPRRTVAFDGDIVPSPDEIQAAILERELQLIREDKERGARSRSS